jgi:hypothetical protein
MPLRVRVRRATGATGIVIGCLKDRAALDTVFWPDATLESVAADYDSAQ